MRPWYLSNGGPLRSVKIYSKKKRKKNRRNTNNQEEKGLAPKVGQPRMVKKNLILALLVWTPLVKTRTSNEMNVRMIYVFITQVEPAT